MPLAAVNTVDREEAIIIANVKYAKLPDESDYDYGLRLISIKVEQNPDDLDWQDVVDYTGLECHRDSLRKACSVTPYSSYQVMKYFQNKIMNQEVSPSDETNKLEYKIAEFKKERQRMFDQRNAYNKILRERARQEELNEILERAVSSGNLNEFEFSPPNISPTNQDLLVSLNDIHYGADVDNYWNKYNSDICVKMFEYYAARVIEAKRIYNAQNCYIWANGDEISGAIHNVIALTNKENVIEQIIGVSELISKFLHCLSSEFDHVYFLSVGGNHSRIAKKDEALAAERLDVLIPWYLSARLQNCSNVVICDDACIDPTMYMIDIRGKTYLGVHGDLEDGGAKVLALSAMVDKDVYAVLSGHKHHNKVDTVQDILTVMAGSFLGTDEYCVGKRIKGSPQQLICVCDETGITAFENVMLNRYTSIYANE